MIRTPRNPTANGTPVPRNVVRVRFAAEQLLTRSFAATRDAICAKFGVQRTAATRDIAAARKLIAAEMDVTTIRVTEVLRNERLADHSEALAHKAAHEGDYAGASTLRRTAILASREITRLTGAAAPVRIQISNGLPPELPLQIDQALAELDDRDRADLDRITAKLEAARAAGRMLPEPAEDESDGDDVEDAEIVGETREPGTN